MSTSAATIRSWFDRGVKEGKSFMIVWCDTYDYDDYPDYHDTAEEAQRKLNTSGQNMQKAMECYDLKAPPGPQFAKSRMWALRIGDQAPGAEHVGKRLVEQGVAYQDPNGNYHLTKSHKEALASVGIKVD